MTTPCDNPLHLPPAASSQPGAAGQEVLGWQLPTPPHTPTSENLLPFPTRVTESTYPRCFTCSTELDVNHAHLYEPLCIHFSQRDEECKHSIPARTQVEWWQLLVCGLVLNTNCFVFSFLCMCLSRGSSCGCVHLCTCVYACMDGLHVCICAWTYVFRCMYVCMCVHSYLCL